MRAVTMILACLAVSGTFFSVAPARAATDDSTQSSPPPQSERDCQRQRDTPTS